MQIEISELERSWRQGAIEQIQGGNARQAVVIVVIVFVVHRRMTIFQRRIMYGMSYHDPQW
jgi:hypothetical protein